MYKLLCKRLIYQNQYTLPFTRTCIQQCQTQAEKKIEKSRVSNIRKYWFDKYIDYVKNYEHIMEKNFPQTMQVYRVFTIGTRELIKEVKRSISIVKKPINDLTTEELQISYTMPKDLIKMCPVLLICAIPFTNYVIFPLAYYFPRYLLTSHYWTPQQKLDFLLLDHKKRLKHNRPLFRCMQAELHNIKNQTLKAKWDGVIACLGSGTHPHIEDIITCSELFNGSPYALENLKRRHITELLAIHDISSWGPFRKKKLFDRGMLIKQMDEAIQKEGGVTEMSNDAICWALSFRGLSPANMSIENMRKWLDQWLIISNTVKKNTISLLLHSPILLAYNHPNNWILIYS
ncbi:PREDICTED: LETM1 domain-containing protein 1 [Dufourea novaeangliae]|uniref:LETM1 domain-containing protein 1 n=1 Tax=Dufourea novaeangliae TaxID=178035 RepID=A0A154PH07_DUFNO|nr:PREDICTED: LETM1 domain-containing protein 1 [Dufourea novaeangliae]KZC10598.1 LETM1 domain-containing protein 1 [Dufourea novaeangliae]